MEASQSEPVAFSWAERAMVALLIAIIIISIVGNCLVCVAIFTDRRLRKLGNAFIVSLAIADLFVSCLVMTFALCNDLMNYWIFGDWFCDIWISFDIMCCTASILNLCAISLDRFIHIKDCLLYNQWMTRRVAFSAVLIIWFISALVSFVPINLGWHKRDYFTGHSTATGTPTTTTATTTTTTTTTENSTMSNEHRLDLLRHERVFARHTGSMIELGAHSANAASSEIENLRTIPLMLTSKLDYPASVGGTELAIENQSSLLAGTSVLLHELAPLNELASKHATKLEASSDRQPDLVTSGATAAAVATANAGFSSGLEWSWKRRRQRQLLGPMETPPEATTHNNNNNNDNTASSRTSSKSHNTNNGARLVERSPSSTREEQLEQAIGVESAEQFNQVEFNPQDGFPIKATSRAKIGTRTRVEAATEAKSSMDSIGSANSPMAGQWKAANTRVSRHFRPHQQTPHTIGTKEKYGLQQNGPQTHNSELATNSNNQARPSNLNGAQLPQCMLNLTPTYAIISSTISFLIPCIIMLGLYSRLFACARRHVRNIQAISKAPIPIAAIGVADSQGDASGSGFASVSAACCQPQATNQGRAQVRPHNGAGRAIVGRARTWIKFARAGCGGQAQQQRNSNTKTRTPMSEKGVDESSAPMAAACDSSDLPAGNSATTSTAPKCGQLNGSSQFGVDQATSVGVQLSSGATEAVGEVTDTAIVEPAAVVATNQASKVDLKGSATEQGVENERLLLIKEACNNTDKRANSTADSFCRPNQLSRQATLTSVRSTGSNKLKSTGIVGQNQSAQQNQQQYQQQQQQQQQQSGQLATHKAAVTLGIIMGTFLFCWVPFFCLNITKALCDDCIPSSLFRAFTWLGYANSALNPIIYGIHNSEFRNAFNRIFFKHLNIKSSRHYLNRRFSYDLRPTTNNRNNVVGIRDRNKSTHSQQTDTKLIYHKSDTSSR